MARPRPGQADRRPARQSDLGHGDGAPGTAAWRWRTAVLASDLPRTGDRETFYRGRIGESGAVIPALDQDSGSQKTIAEADVLIRRRAETPAAPTGSEVEVLDY